MQPLQGEEQVGISQGNDYESHHKKVRGRTSLVVGRARTIFVQSKVIKVNDKIHAAEFSQKKFLILQSYFRLLTHGVIGNTSDFGSEESRFETWWVNTSAGTSAGIFILTRQVEKFTLTIRVYENSSGKPGDIGYVRFTLVKPPIQI